MEAALPAHATPLFALQSVSRICTMLQTLICMVVHRTKCLSLAVAISAASAVTGHPCSIKRVWLAYCSQAHLRCIAMLTKPALAHLPQSFA